MSIDISYILTTFKAAANVPALPEIDHGFGGAAPIQIYNSHTHIFRDQLNVPDNAFTLIEWEGTEIPILYPDGSPELITQEDGITKIHFDLYASAFYFLSGWQEYVAKKKDHFGRYPYAESLQQRTNTVHIPIVNYYFDILKQAIARVSTARPAADVWAKGEFSVFLSHDIDKCRSGWKEDGKHELKKGRFLSFLKLVYKRFLGRDEWFNLDLIADIEQRHEAKSTFFILCRKGMIGNIPHADYDADAAYMQSEYDKVIAAGSELAVHGSFGAHLDSIKFKADLATLNRDSEGNRYHYLSYDIDKTPQLLAAAGMKYDATLGFAEHIGFRNGICHPFFLYDHEKGQATDVLEIPLMVMDTTFMNPNYMDLNMEEIPGKVDEIMAEIKKFRGVLSVLWHNNYFSQYKYAGWRELYELILQKCIAANGEFLTAKEINAHWREKSQ